MKWQGQKLKALVAERGYTQEAFGKRVGVSRQAFSAWVRGKVPRGVHLLRICRDLGVSADVFFAGAITKLPARKMNGDAIASGAFVRETTGAYATPIAGKSGPRPLRKARRAACARPTMDPFLALIELADRTASSLTNKQMDEVIYGR